MHKCTTFSASSLIHRFLLSARSGSTRYHKTSSNTISSLGSHIIPHWRFCTPYSLGFYGNPKLISSQKFGHPNSYHTLIQCGSLPCGNTLVGSVRYPITLQKYTVPYHLLSYTQHYYIAEVCSTSNHCWAITNANTLLRYIEPITLLSSSQV